MARAVISHQGQALLTHALGQVKTATSWMAAPDLRSRNKLQEWSRWNEQVQEPKMGITSAIHRDLMKKTALKFSETYEFQSLGPDGEILPVSHCVLDK